MKRIVMLAALAVVTGGAAHAGDDASSMNALLGVLESRGVISAGEREALSSKNSAWEAKQAESRPSISLWGDLRARYERFSYDEDETGSERDSRHRGRYRIRLNGKATGNDHASVHFRIASGHSENGGLTGDPRSTNQTFGSSLDFDSDNLWIERAYAHLTPFAHGRMGENGTLALQVGKVPNPYTWKNGKDFMLWDGDINLEGVNLRSTWEFSSGVEWFGHGGYYVIDENSSRKDPHLWAVQTGVHLDPGPVQLGGRATYYHFDSLDPAFHMRGQDGTGAPTGTGGNILDGLSGGVGGQNVRVVEAAGYLKAKPHDSWPVTLYGTWSNNLTAENSSLVPGAAQEDTAWGVGAELGSKKEMVKLGVGYWHIEANAFPSQFIDSDLTDGRTNREGWAFYGSRRILKHMDANLPTFLSDEIEDTLPAYDDSVPNAERVRVQADLVVKF